MKKLYYLPLVAGLLVMSVVLSGRRTNPPVTHEIKWDTPSTEETFLRACADCHSHETQWPWYSKMAPASWFVIHHVNEGREHFNISSGKLGDADEAAEKVEEGKMPLPSYIRLHADARLTPEEKKAFVVGLEKTFGREQDDHHDHMVDHEDDDSDSDE